MTGLETSTLLAISVGTSVAGTAVSAIGAMNQGKAAQQAANFNAQVAQNNAIAARQAAAENARREARAGRIRTGALRARSNLDASMDLLEDSVMEEELNVNSILHAGELEALGLETSASLSRAQGAAARQAGNAKAFGSLLSGAGKAAGSLPSGGTGETVSLFGATRQGASRNPHTG